MGKSKLRSMSQQSYELAVIFMLCKSTAKGDWDYMQQSLRPPS